VERRPRRPITHGRGVWVAALVLVLTLVPALVAGAAVDDTSVVSLATDGTPADGPSGPGVVVSPSGRHVVFESTADNLSDADDDSVVNLYLHDRETGETTLVSRASGVSGAGADADSTNAAISPGGARYVAFESRAANLSTVDGDPTLDVFVRDLETNTTTLVSRAPDGSPADGDSGNPALSQKAAKIVFESQATNLSDTDLDVTTDVFVYDAAAGTTTLVSATGTGAGGDDSSFDPTISNDGTRIAFASDADNLRPDDDDTVTNIFLAQPRFRLMTPISRDTTSGVIDHPGDGDSFQPVISATGARVAFTSRAGNLTDESIATPSIVDVFVREVSAKKTTLVSRADGVGGAPGFADSHSPSISEDGRLVAFTSSAGNLSTADGPGTDVFVRDTAWDNTVLMSRASGVEGVTGQGDSSAPALARAGNLIAFVSAVDELTADPGDIQQPTVFARELLWRAPPVYVRPPDTGGHHGGGDGHGGADDGHDATGHAADGHAPGTAAHGHAAGGAHFLLKLGGVTADRLFGTPLHDKLCGGGGNDVISLGGGPDVGYGGACGPVEPPTVTKSGWWRTLPALWRHAGDADSAPKSGPGVNDNDRLTGGKGDDALFGGPGSDRLVGGSGADYLSGGSGHDRLVGGPGRNRIEGGGGSDSINSANGVREMVDCGFGDDSVTADRRDVLTGCERVKRVRRKSRKELIELLPECPGGGHECHNGSDTVVLSTARRAG
jgi:Tol biopolymer transport system component